jgi:hypothetical protein
MFDFSYQRTVLSALFILLLHKIKLPFIAQSAMLSHHTLIAVCISVVDASLHQVLNTDFIVMLLPSFTCPIQTEAGVIILKFFILLCSVLFLNSR